MIRNFLYEVCSCHGRLDHGRLSAGPPSPPCREKIGDGKVLLALSGGVDSSVAAALLAEAVGDQLTCVFVDHGLMRKNEGDEVEAAVPKWDHATSSAWTPSARFLGKLAGVTEPEHKRKIIGEEFIRVFEEEAKKIGRGGLTWPRAPSTPTSSSPARAMPPSSRATTTWAACPTTSTSRRSSSRCACCSRTRSASWAASWACRNIWSCASPSPAPALPSASSATSRKEKLDTLRDADAIFREEMRQRRPERLQHRTSISPC